MTGERLYASLAAEEAERLECCRMAIAVAHRKYDAGAALSETEAGLDARTAYITISRRAGVPVPTPPPSVTMESPAASTPPERESDTSKSEPRLSGEASPVSVAAKSGGVESPQILDGEWYFTCAKCGRRKQWVRRGAMPEKPMPGAVCWDCWKEAHPR